MKTVKKETMDEAIRIAREYWESGGEAILIAQIVQMKELSRQAFNSDHKWICFEDLIDSMIKLDKQVSNEAIYAAFALVGINATEEVA